MQIVEHSSVNATVLGSSRKLGGAAEHLIDGSEKRICRLSFEYFRVRKLLKLLRQSEDFSYFCKVLS